MATFWHSTSPSLEPGQRLQPLILHVDDTREMGKLVELMLERYLRKPHHYLFTTDGYVALDLARQYLPDLILSDYMRPSLGGDALLKEVRQDQELRLTPYVFFSSAASNVSTLIWLMHLGAQDVIPKPCDGPYIAATIRRYL